MTKTTERGGRPSVETDHVAQRVREILEENGEQALDRLRPVLRLSSNQLVKFYKETQETTERTAKRHIYGLTERLVYYRIEKVKKGYRVFYQIPAPEEVVKQFGELVELLDREEKERLREEIEDLHWTLEGVKEMARILAERPTSK
ncbi:MAG: hypothetical protein V3U51_00155 [Thermoplasmata archaeon]